ncbi:hypothetical protein TD95_000717 [Thielaviopsis punctulata]|uniref:Transaldolase n=1 Tax=Thielaviopsis punctulata TaxID=72032 RepID=A0A0F4ZJR2_9PEZI|nr:hypothetical protein TD95_000717 [Thielaviopsis punctulata]
MDSPKMNMLQALDKLSNIDVDWMDLGFIQSTQFVFHDMTSNQFIVDAALRQPETRPFIEQAVRELPGSAWLDVYTRAAVLICKSVLPHITGRVFLQTRTCHAYDAQATLLYARQIAAEMDRAGIGLDRYGIKIPITGPAMLAARDLQGDGITVLGTTLFNVPQAIAASQAGCFYVAPYFNGMFLCIVEKNGADTSMGIELLAHSDSSVWPQSDDPATDHPMAATVSAMNAAFASLHTTTGRDQPRIKLASLLSTAECIAAAELRCHSVTIAPKLLAALEKMPAGPVEAREPDKVDAEWLKTDLLADGGKPLDIAVDQDKDARRKLDYALEFFDKYEKASRELVEGIMAELQ